MEDLENLGQRTYDIQQCLSYAASGAVDQSVVAALNSKMGILEKSLANLESRVSAQLSLIEEIPSIVSEAKSLFAVCQDIPTPSPTESSDVVLALRKSSSRRSQQQLEPAPEPDVIASEPVEQAPKPTKAPKVVMAASPSPAEEAPSSFVRPVTEAELKGLSKSVFFRVSAAKVNAWVDEINAVLEKKSGILRTAPSNIKAATKRTWERYDSEKIDGDSRLFFTMEDVKEMPTLKNNQKNALTVLQSLGRVYSSTDAQMKRWFVK
jgi:hypothetical protein